VEDSEKEGQINQGLNIYLYYWTIPVLIALIIINYYTPIVRIEYPYIDLMISVVTFLFGFLITITFSMLLTKVSALKTALSDETGRLVSLYLLSEKLGKEFKEKITENIDEYTIQTLKSYTHYEAGREANYNFYRISSLMEIKNKNQETAANSFMYVLGELQAVREKLEGLTARRTEWSLKFANYLLGIILIILLFINRSDPFTNTLFVVLSTIIIFIFLIIEDYDSLHIGDYTHNISNSEQLFDLIGRERYYPQNLVQRAKLEEGKIYRIGVYDPAVKEERMFRIKYSPKFYYSLKKIKSKLNPLNRLPRRNR